MSGKEILGKLTNDPPCKSVALLALHACTIEGHVTCTAWLHCEPAGSSLNRNAYNTTDCQQHAAKRIISRDNSVTPTLVVSPAYTVTVM